MNIPEVNDIRSNDIMDNIYKFYIIPFCKEIQAGVGYIEDDDVMRQFYLMFPSFNNLIFNPEALEANIKFYLNKFGLIK